MAKMNREVAKTLIRLSPTVEEANKTVEEYLGNSPTFKEKIAFLKGMFDCPEVIDQKPDDCDELVYTLLLNGIVSKH